MKKKDFITLILSVVGGLLFALSMCMALVPEMGTITQGSVVGSVGLVVLLAMIIVRRKMDGKPAVVFNGKIIGITLYSIFSAAIFGAGMFESNAMGYGSRHCWYCSAALPDSNLQGLEIRRRQHMKKFIIPMACVAGITGIAAAIITIICRTRTAE